MKAKRNYRDSMFRKLFNDKKALLELYNALTGTDYRDPKAVRITTLRGTFFNDVKNDVSFELDGKYIILFEHQSTVNENMPLRCLFYAAKLYYRLIDARTTYRAALVKIPTPQFHVFYRGQEKLPATMTLRLSDAFRAPGGMMELTVTVHNIRQDARNPLLKRSRSLDGYSFFMYMVEKMQQEGTSKEDAIRETIGYCIEHGILTEFLEQNAREVTEMISMKWDENIAKEVWKEEWTEESRAEEHEATLVANLRSLMETTKWSKTKAMDSLKVPPAMRKKIAPLL